MAEVKTIYELGLHETMRAGMSTVMRVAGGWLYIRDLNQVFVPYSAEFDSKALKKVEECSVNCGDNYCDENGCVDRKRHLTNDEPMIIGRDSELSDADRLVIEIAEDIPLHRPESRSEGRDEPVHVGRDSELISPIGVDEELYMSDAQLVLDSHDATTRDVEAPLSVEAHQREVAKRNRPHDNRGWTPD